MCALQNLLIRGKIPWSHCRPQQKTPRHTHTHTFAVDQALGRPRFVRALAPEHEGTSAGCVAFNSIWQSGFPMPMPALHQVQVSPSCGASACFEAQAELRASSTLRRGCVSGRNETDLGTAAKARKRGRGESDRANRPATRLSQTVSLVSLYAAFRS